MRATITHFVFVFVLVVWFGGVAEAQLFRRFQRTTHETRWSNNAHWGYPGESSDDANRNNLRSHLAGYPYYLRSDGMTPSEVLAAHDALHEGRQYHVANVSKMVAPVQKAVPMTVARPTIQAAKPMMAPKPERSETPKETSFWQ